jgi:hypothetical protein
MSGWRRSQLCSVDQLEQLGGLRDPGVLSDVQFEIEKKGALGG